MDEFLYSSASEPARAIRGGEVLGGRQRPPL
jgi:hypothetical protein